MNGKLRLAAARIENSLASRIGKIETTGFAHATRCNRQTRERLARSDLEFDRSRAKLIPIDVGAVVRESLSPTAPQSAARSTDLVEAGSSEPRDICTTPIEFSVVTNCGPLACTSISVRPRHGRISACSPVIKCARFSFVETCAVNRQRRNAAAVNSVSGVAERKLPPSAKKTLALPSCIA